MPSHQEVPPGLPLGWHIRLLLMVPWMIALQAGMLEGVWKWRSGQPEWTYYTDFVHRPLALATGPDEKLFGYLPGAKALLAPFVLAGTAGYFVFLVLGCWALLGIHRIMAERFLAAAPDATTARWRLFWLSLCLAGPSYMALQNNQVVTVCVCLVLMGMGCVRRRMEIAAGCLLAVAILIKTLPVATLALPFLLGRYRAPIYAVVLAAGTSFLMAGVTDGMTSSVFHHVAWPHQVSQQSPLGLLRGSVPESLESNQSALAFCTRFAHWITVPPLAYVPVAVSLVCFVLLSVSTLRHRSDNRRETFWLLVAAWLAWVSFSAPFGRYYYVLFCVPVWYLAGTRGNMARSRWRWLLGVLPVAPFTMGGHNPVYAVVGLATLVIGCFMVWKHAAPDSVRARRLVSNFPPQLVVPTRLATAGLALMAAASFAVSITWRSDARVLDEVAAGLSPQVNKDGGDLIVVSSAQTFRDSNVDDFVQAQQTVHEGTLLEELADKDIDTYIVPYAHIRQFEALKSRLPLRRVGANEGFVVYRERKRTPQR